MGIPMSVLSPYDFLRLNLSIVPGKSGTHTDEDKRPCIKWKEYQTRLPTRREIDDWLRQWPRCNWLLITGGMSNVVVLDIDSQEGVEEVKRRGGFDKETPIVRTAKGWHIYFQHPGFGVRNRVRFIPGCDLRGDCGYVLAAGSVHPSGAVYRWIHSMEDYELLPMPMWLLELAINQPRIEPVAPQSERRDHKVPIYVQTVFDLEIEKLAKAEYGTRNSQLFKTTRRLFQFVGSGHLHITDVVDRIESAIVAFDRYAEHPVDRKNVQDTLKRASVIGMGSPAVIPARLALHSDTDNVGGRYGRE